jgi:O-antigen ligase
MLNRLIGVNSLLAVFLFLVGAVALVLRSGYSIGFYGLGFVGLVYWLQTRERLIDVKANWFLVPVLFYASVGSSQALLESFAWRSLDPFAPFFFMIFSFYVLRQFKPMPKLFWLGIAVGAIGAACFSGYQAMALGVRAGGYLHPIQFGNIALLLGVLCLVRALLTLDWTWMNLLMWLGFISGLAASVWSQTRGGWVALVLILVWVLMHATRQWTWLKRGVALATLIACLAAIALHFGFAKVIESRVAEVAVEVHAFVDTNKQDTSVGARLAMWRKAIQHMSDAPLLGVGAHGWLQIRDQGLADGDLQPFIANFSHVHNEYLDVLVRRGVVGLAALLLLYLGPMLMFYRPYLNAVHVEVKSLAMAGMVIPMMYMDFGLTQLFLGHNSGRMVLVSLWVCAAALLLNVVEDNEQHDAT